MDKAFKNIDQTWSLFLDRDGVINQRRYNDYVKSWDEFIFLENVPETIARCSRFFKHVFVVTNQQGIGKGIMTEAQLLTIHHQMQQSIVEAGGKLDGVYFCPALAQSGDSCRKPETGMALKAKADYPAVDFTKCIMVGDSNSDIQFGKKAGMKTVFIDHGDGIQLTEEADAIIHGLKEVIQLFDISKP